MNRADVRLSITLLVLLTSLTYGCTGLITLQPQTMPSRHLPQYWLTISMFASNFYDDDKLRLLDYRPYFGIDYLKNLDNITIYPPKADKIIPAGTLVQIVDISYPNETTSLKRPIYSPKDHVWVYLRVGRERGKVSIFHEKTHILLVPKNISEEKALKGYLGRFLSNKDPNRWILQQQSYIQDGIFKKQPVIGMNKQQIMATLGPALKKQFKKEFNFESASEIWHYHDYLVIFTEDVVSKINNLSK